MRSTLASVPLKTKAWPLAGTTDTGQVSTGRPHKEIGHAIAVHIPGAGHRAAKLGTRVGDGKIEGAEEAGIGTAEDKGPALL